MANKREMGIINSYKNYAGRTLSDCYKKASAAKERAYAYCRDKQIQYNGYDFRIISYNTFMFTVGFKFVDTNTGKIMFMHITPSKDEIFEYPA